jgi:hypothetical protein
MAVAPVGGAAAAGGDTPPLRQGRGRLTLFLALPCSFGARILLESFTPTIGYLPLTIPAGGR